MDEALIDTADAPLERRSLLPGAGFFVPEEYRDARRDEEIAAAVDGADAVVVADPDADGLGAVAVIRARHPDAAIVPTSPHDLADGLERAAAHAAADATVFVCDLCPDESADLAALEALTDGRDVRWFDHHQWSADLASEVRAAGVELTVGESEDVCTTDVAVAQLGATGDVPERLVELAAVTRDHDLWINDDPRSEDLADYAHWVEPEEYVDVVAEHGADLPPAAEQLLSERRIEKRALIERAVDRAAMREVGPWTVGVTYGRCSQNEVADALREDGADAAVVVKPAGSASIRGSDAFERCHEVAGRVNGGGHPKAAGCKPDVHDDMLDYATHWTSQGAVTKQVILDAFRAVAEAAAAEEEGIEVESGD